MATIRIFLFTYNRHNLLPRALESILNQTYKDWICELHNDQPNDLFPEQLAKSYKDERIIIKNHTHNLGGTKSFNLAFKESNEKYISLLEDDNWWETNFLEEMVQMMDKFPQVAVSWCNMKCWKEHENNNWEDMGINTTENVSEPLFIYETLNIKQLHGALHSNSAMLIRSVNSYSYKTPASTWQDVIESVRERVFDYPILFLNNPLANFSFTIQTYRTKDLSVWNAWQVMMVGSYLSNIKWNKAQIKDFWNNDTLVRKKNAHHYIMSLFFFKNIFRIVKFAPLSAWFFFLGYYMKKPYLFIETCFKIKKNYPLKQFIELNTHKQLMKS